MLAFLGLIFMVLISSSSLFYIIWFISLILGGVGSWSLFLLIAGGALLGAAVGFWEKDWPSFGYSDLSFLDAFP
ncbi:hypothetical protein KFK09_024078 [Dendrobium nobile]|uniref:Uncharacterized protein n=1 Tax=Dendrobium nobile TaxID=94219 RepID=A0A8T3ACV7_DENNO|nr:hypothetical protein KFK09_024078 [Dendrobium nobile]